MVPVKDHNILDRGGNNGVAERRLDSACILKKEATEFDDKLDIGGKEG